jgi:tetratricopeptide (TPR) repeat protein
VGATACGGSSGANGSKNPQATFAAALQLEQRGDLADSAQLFEQVLLAEPNNYAALYNLGVIAQEQHDIPAALNEYGRALKVNPRYVPALFNSAGIYATTRPSVAIAVYRKIVALQPIAPTAYLGLGKLEIRHGQPRQGVKDLATALSQDASLLPQIPRPLRTLVRSQAARIQTASPSPAAAGTASP